MSMTIEIESGTATLPPRGPQGYSSGHFPRPTDTSTQGWVSVERSAPSRLTDHQCRPT